MKIIIISGTLAFLVLAGCQAARQEEKLYPYPYDTAKITYEIKGSVEGSKTTFLKGNKSSVEIHQSRKTSGAVENLDSLIIDAGEFIYQVDLDTKTGTINKNPVYQELKKIAAAQRQEFLEKLATGTVGENNTKPNPKEQKEIAGQKCDLYAIEGFGEVCLWYGIPVYSRVEISGVSITETATRIETNIEIADQKFILPDGIKMQDLSK